VEKKKILTEEEDVGGRSVSRTFSWWGGGGGGGGGCGGGERGGGLCLGGGGALGGGGGVFVGCGLLVWGGVGGGRVGYASIFHLRFLSARESSSSLREKRRKGQRPTEKIDPHLRRGGEECARKTEEY